MKILKFIVASMLFIGSAVYGAHANSSVNKTEHQAADSTKHTQTENHATEAGTEQGTEHATEHNAEHGAEHGAEHSAEAGKLDVSEILMHHVMDSHEWHITDVPGSWVGSEHKYAPIALKLPYIIFRKSATMGNELFAFIPEGHTHHEVEKELHERGLAMNKYGQVLSLHAGDLVLDFSITKSVFQMMLVSIVLIFVFLSMASAARKNAGKAPKGIQSFFEPIVVFIRDEVAAPNMHGKHAKYMPYLLTLFFFIWFANLLGLTPFNSNIAGNTSFTVAMAILTFIIVQFSGTKDYWQHVFWYPGVPFLVKLIMLPVELIGLVTKPFALTVRLFANIAGGHFIVLSLVSLIFILNNSNGLIAAAAITPISVAFALFIMAVEMIVAIVQAYVFTLLTAVFIGQALETHHHEKDDHSPEHAI